MGHKHNKRKHGPFRHGRSIKNLIEQNKPSRGFTATLTAVDEQPLLPLPASAYSANAVELADGRCHGSTSKGAMCRRRPADGARYCSYHAR